MVIDPVSPPALNQSAHGKFLTLASRAVRDAVTIGVIHPRQPVSPI
jgi:hypothetical protein